MAKAQKDIAVELHKQLHHTGLPMAFFEMFLRKLESFRFQLVQEDLFALIFAVHGAVHRVQTYCNIKSIPKEALPKVADLSIGIFLGDKLQNGQLNLGELDFSSVIQSVTEGDTSVTFGVNASDRISALFRSMTNLESGELACYKKLRW